VVIHSLQLSGDIISNLYWLTEAQMERLQPYSPKSQGRARVDDRRVLSGIIFINRNGLRWCDAPSEYGPPKTLHNRWKRWSDMGIFAQILMGLAEQAPDNKTISIPSHRNCVSTARQWMVLSRFSSGLFRAMFVMKEIKNGNEIHRRVSA
jgi:transposase